jgi:hypothetical protein
MQRALEGCVIALWYFLLGVALFAVTADAAPRMAAWLPRHLYSCLQRISGRAMMR